MKATVRLGWILCAGICGLLWSGTCVPRQKDIDNPCNQHTRMREVMVLSVEDLRREPELAQEFVVRHAGEFRLLSTKPEEIRIRSRPSRNPRELVRRARKLGAERGCDLVVVLKTGPYFGHQGKGWARNGYGWPRRIKNGGYALVVMGERKEIP